MMESVTMTSKMLRLLEMLERFGYIFYASICHYGALDDRVLYLRRRKDWKPEISATPAGSLE